MSQFRTNQGTTTKAYQTVRRGGVTQNGAKLAIAVLLLVAVARRLRLPRRVVPGTNPARNAGSR